MRRSLLALALLLPTVAILAAWRAAPSAAPLPVLRIVKSPTCACCQAWADYMAKQGFTVQVENRDDFTALKRANGVTRELESCHTAFVGDLVIEGHVPADLVKRLLAKRPAGVKGIAAPGMPRGAPGMEGPVHDRHTIYTFDAKGKATAYAER